MNNLTTMKTYTKNEQQNLNLLSTASKKFSLDEKEIDFVAGDKFLFSYVFLLAVSKKKVHLLSADNKKPEVFDVSEVKAIQTDNKVDLNLYLKGGRVINLTSVVDRKKTTRQALEQIKSHLNID